MATPHELPDLGPGAPTAPIALAGEPSLATGRLANAVVEVPDKLVDKLRDVCASVSVDPALRAESSRDWWPLAMTWALDNQVPNVAGAVARPSEPSQVAAVLKLCNDAKVP